MLVDLIRDEILSNPDWVKVKQFTVYCSKLFKYKFFSELVNGFMTISVNRDTMVGSKHELIEKYAKYLYPDDILLEFEIKQTSGYKLIPKQYDDAPPY